MVELGHGQGNRRSFAGVDKGYNLGDLSAHLSEKQPARQFWKNTRSANGVHVN